MQEKLLLPTLQLRYGMNLLREIKNINKEHKCKAVVKSFIFDKKQQKDPSEFVYF